jgi:hypothetical protein
MRESLTAQRRHRAITRSTQRRRPFWIALLPVVLGATTSLSWVGPAQATVGGPVGTAPASFTPSLATSGTDGSVEQVRQLVPCGPTMYAVGRFTSIKQAGTTYTRNNAFSFSSTTGAVSAWDPNVNGRVDSVALSADCSTAYLGGKFTSVGGTTVNNIASVSTSTGAVNTGFAHTANGVVSALLVAGPHLLAGGYYTKINGSTREYMTSLNLATGRDDGYVNLNISGNYQYTDDGGRTVSANPTRVYNYALSPSGAQLLVMGDFTSVGGLGRRQIFMLDLGGLSTSVDPWYSSEFDANCATVEPFWLQDASWAPDASTIYIATTGYKPANGLGYSTSDPRAGLCDAAAAFPAAPRLVSHLWVNYTGCDSYYSTAADSKAVYVGGHERWASNPLQCDNNNSGTAVVAPGMVGLSPGDGSVVVNPTRARGQGADDMLTTSAGLWIASDNAQNANTCGKLNGKPAPGHAGICLLPY